MSYAIEKKRVHNAESSAWLEAADEELLQRYCERGDRQAFTALVHRYERELYSYLRRYLGDAAMAEDAFQSTFLQVHLKCDQFEEGRKVRPWLYTVATNQAIDAQRRNRRHRMMSLDRRYGTDDQEDIGSLMGLLDDQQQGPGDLFQAAEDGRHVREAVDRLPETLRRVVLLVYYQGLKYREAA